MPPAARALSGRRMCSRLAPRPNVMTGSCSSKRMVSPTRFSCRASANCCINWWIGSYRLFPSQNAPSGRNTSLIARLAMALLRHRLAPVASRLPECFEAGVELPRHVGIELRSRAAIDLRGGDFVRKGTAVGAVAGHRVVRVGHGDDAGHHGDVFALQAE